MDEIILIILSITAFFVLIVIGILFGYIFGKEKEINYCDYNYYYSFGLFSLTIICAPLAFLITGFWTGSYKKMRAKVKNKMEKYAFEHNLHFSEGNQNTRIYIDKEKKKVCIYEEKQIIELDFNEILNYEMFNDEKLQIYGWDYWISTKTVYSSSSIKIYTNTEHSVITLKYNRKRIISSRLQKTIYNYIKTSEKILNYAITHGNKKINSENNEKANVDNLREYKKLLDEGIITQKEFDIKKEEILNNK